MSDKEVKVKVTADDKATPVLNRFIGFVKSRVVVTMGDLFGAFRLVLGGIKKVADEAIEAEKSMSELSSAMKNAGTFTTEAFEAQNEFANSLQKTVLASDDQIRSTQAMLVSLAGLRGEGLNQTTKAVLDFAARTGTDAVSAAQLFGKTIGGPVNALARYGIVVTGAAGSTERMESATRNAAILFGGAATAQTETFDGKLKQLNKSVGEVFETISTESISGSKDYLDSLKNMVEGTGNYIQSVQRRKEILLLAAQVEKQGYQTLSAEQAKFLLDNKKEADKYRLSRRLDEQKLQDQLLMMQNIAQKDRENQEKKNQIQKNVKSGAAAQEKENEAAELLEKEAGQKKADELKKRISQMEAYFAEIKRMREISVEEEIAGIDRILKTTEEKTDGLIELKQKQDSLVAQIRTDNEKKIISDKLKREEAAAEQNALNNDRVIKEKKDKEDKADDQALISKKQLEDAFVQLKQTSSDLMVIAAATGNKEIFEISKAAGIATATVDAYVSANAAMASLPPPFSFIAAGAAIAAGLANVQMISAQKFAQGGIVGGNSTTGDKVPALLNSGEVVLNDKQQNNIMDLANGKKQTAPAPAPTHVTVNLMLDKKILAKQIIDLQRQYQKGLI